ncbi:MAG: serine/threonine protein kinase [Phycisphaerales bacterium]|nr:serine/threonine protein kinase [Phycisphaerales bacterium]
MTDKDPSAASNVDTLLGRIVVEQGLATSQEVAHCFEVQRQQSDAKEASLADLLLQNNYVTLRQLDRLRREVEAQKSTQQIPGYSIKKKLGAGAMASVYLARQISLDRMVAIKVLPKKYNSNVNFIDRFYKEGRAAAKLNHPNIVQAYDVGKAGEFHYFVMEYVEGGTVYDILTKKGRIPEKDAIDIILQIADALNHAHEKGFVHRDVKPKNIMFTKEGVAKLADMGLARAVSDIEAAKEEEGRAFGTPYYISPEQIRGEVNIGAQADIYSLGAMFYHMVTGQVPFDGENPTAVMHKHLKADLTPPDHVNPKLSAGVSEVIEMMMAKSRRERYHNCRDLIEDLRLIAAGAKPRLAHKEMDLSGLTGGTMIPPDQLEDTGVLAAPQPVVGNGSSPFSHPAVMLLLILLGVSLLGNVVMLIVSMTR